MSANQIKTLATNDDSPLRRGRKRHPWIPLLLLLAGTLALSACSNDYSWVRKDNMEWAQKYMATQHAEKQELIQQQGQVNGLLEKLNATLAQNERLAQVLERLNQTLAQPLRLDVSQLHIVQTAAAATPDSSGQSSAKPTPDDKKILVGSTETVWFPQLKKKIESRVDTGAASSSLNAASYEIIERDGEKWVRFTLEADKDKDDKAKSNKEDDKKKDDKKADKEDSTGSDKGKDEDKDKKKAKADADKPETYEQKLVRHVKILQSSTDDADRRPVIKLRVVIGSVAQEAEFTLADRDHLSYDALIGRNALRDLMIVDVSKNHVTKLPDDIDKEESKEKEAEDD